MGTYCTTTTLDTVMVGTQFDTATSALAVECITWAEADANKYLSARFDIGGSYFLTSTATPPVVRAVCEWLSAGYMYEQMARGDKTPKRAERLIKRAEDCLKMISTYETPLLDTAGSVIPDKANTKYRIKSNTSGYSSTFNEDDPLNWRIDDDKLDDIDSERS